MIRSLRSIVALVALPVALLSVVTREVKAQYPPPLVTITPHSAFDGTAPYSVNASVKICMQWGGHVHRLP